MKKRFQMNLNSTQLIMLSFLIAVLLGSALLSLPISAADGERVPYPDALFTATTAVCVTGLVTLPVCETWSGFGQAVLLVLIQIGGLGVITILSGLMISLHRRVGIRNKILLQDVFNLNSLSGVIRFTKKVLFGTFLIEGVGALLYMTVFVPQFGARGIWISVFNAVSAFCNAGIDLVSTSSLTGYVTQPTVNFVTCALIVLGGVGYIVWWDVLRVCRSIRTQRGRFLRGLTLHSKIALSSTVFLLLGGTLVFLVLEYRNPLTIGPLSFAQKLQAALFQSVTTRTAGFATLPQESLTSASAVVSLLLMFIGGSPAGTAGGVKTVTFAVLIASLLATVRGKDEVVLFHRNISRGTVAKAAAVVCMSFFTLFLSTVLLSCVSEADTLDILYETVSATATVGLTRALTPTLNDAGKLIVILTMFLGRVGPISLAVAFQTRRESPNIIKHPTEEISVG